MSVFSTQPDVFSNQPSIRVKPSFEVTRERTEPIAFAGMKNHESISMGGCLSSPTKDVLEVEFLLYPDVLAGCPDRFHWDYGDPPLYGQDLVIDNFEVELKSSPNAAVVTSHPAETTLNIEDVWISREENRTRVRIRPQSDIRFYGLGEQFASLEHSGRRIVCESVDWWNRNWTDPPGWKHTYCPIPFVLTNEGYGILISSTARVTFDFTQCGQAGGQGFYSIETETAGIRLSIIPGGSLKEIIQRLVQLTGPPYTPPRWGQEPLLACASNHKERVWDDRKVDEYIEMFRKHRIPNGMVLDECWAWLRKDPTSPTGYFMHYEAYGAFEPDNYADPAESIRRMRSEGGSRTIFIIGPFIGCNCKYLEFLKEHGWLVRRASNPNLLLMGQYNHYFLDFTNPDAVEWWKEKVKGIVDLGISGFFADFGESDEQMDALYANGGTGRSFGQQYNMLYKQVVHDILREKRGEDFYLIGRAGWTGVQAISGIMQGDPACTFDGMRQTLISLQSSALSGLGVLSQNLGGYAGEQSAIVYLRWIAYGIFCPQLHIWTSGNSGGEPWNFREAYVLDIYRHLMQWRMRLLPYLHSAMQLYRTEYIPMIRPMVLEFPSDLSAVNAVDQFLCGPSLLVAPILNEEGDRVVYIPQGEWIDFWTDELVEGPAFQKVHHPLGSIPVYARQGSIIPMEGNPYFSENLVDEPLEIHVFGEPITQDFRLVDQGHEIQLFADRHEDQVHLSCERIERKCVSWVLHNTSIPRQVRYHGELLAEVNGSGEPGYSWDRQSGKLSILLPSFPSGEIEITL